MDVQPSLRRQPGVTLIEVLVALVVLSIGMLGVGAMFLSTLQDTRSGLYRTKAAAIAWDMVERIRANRIAGDDYEAAEADTGSNTPTCATTKTTPSPDNCSTSELARYDIYEWKSVLADVETGLPDGNGSIVRDATSSPAQYTITVTWREPNSDGQSSVTVVTQL